MSNSISYPRGNINLHNLNHLVKFTYLHVIWSQIFIMSNSISYPKDQRIVVSTILVGLGWHCLWYIPKYSNGLFAMYVKWNLYLADMDHLWAWSEEAPTGVATTLLAEPFSTGGGTPHLPSDSRGSKTWTPPSDKPTANWFGSVGCAAITSGCTLELLHKKWKRIQGG